MRYIILLFFLISCKGQDSIIEISSDQKKTIEVIAEKGDSLLVSFYIPKEYNLKSRKQTHLINISYQKKQTDIHTRALINEFTNTDEKIKVQLILKKHIQRKDFIELTNQHIYIFNKQYEIHNTDILKIKLNNFINDSIKVIYSYRNNRGNYMSILFPVNFNL